MLLEVLRFYRRARALIEAAPASDAGPGTGGAEHARGVELATDQGIEDFEAVVIATHPAQALGFLADATPAEKEALGAMPYSVNHTVFHRDPAVLPTADNARASWNYRLPDCDARPDKVLVSYDLTRLQRLEPADGQPYLVSLGESGLIGEDRVLERMVYEHPQYTPNHSGHSSASRP
jgi:predicted NAD/FAD-binding protein